MLGIKEYMIIFLVLFASYSMVYGQFSNTGFYDKSEDAEICRMASGFMTDEEIVNLVNRMVKKMGLENRFRIQSCSSIENCQAVVYDSRPYILYNKEFLNGVKSMNFSETSLKKSNESNWQAITVLAHELGHHYNFHMTSPHPDMTNRDFELEADEFAGRMLAELGASLDQAQSVYLGSAIPEGGSLNHPDRGSRLKAIKRGWQEGQGNMVVGRADIIKESTIYELCSPKLLAWDLLKLDDGEYEGFNDREIDILKQVSIFPSFTDKNVFQIAFNRVEDIDHYYYIEEDEFGDFHFRSIPSDDKEILLPSEEFQFRLDSSDSQKIILLFSSMYIPEGVRKNLCQSEHLLNEDTILDYFLDNSEDYFSGSIYPMILNLGQ